MNEATSEAQTPATHGTAIAPVKCRAEAAFYSKRHGGDVTVTCEHAPEEHHGGRHGDPKEGYWWHDGDDRGRATHVDGCGAWLFDANAGVLFKCCERETVAHGEHSARKPWPVAWTGAR
jgi:hypothetical protein